MSVARKLRLLAGLTATVLATVVSAASAGPLAISPAAGTPDVSPRTQISVLGVSPARIASVTVTGATSGAHSGRLLPYSHGRGASFVLSNPLTEGERVAVVVRIAGRAPVRFSFGVAHVGATQPPLRIATIQPDKLDHYVSEPGLQAPHVTVLRAAPSLPGSIFLTPLPAPIVHPGSNNTVTISPVGPGGPMVVDGRGRLVWFKQLASPVVAANLRLQRFDGRPVMTWWQGTVTPSAFGLGEGVIADRSYRTIHTVHTGNGYAMDLHEFTLTPDGDALATIYAPVLVHLAGTAAGALSPLLDAIIQEIDVRTGLVVWEWHALGHIPLAESYATPANSASYDAFHINSLQALPGGRILASARDTSAVYEIRRAGSRILWTLGGKAGDFHLGPGARFYFQHDAQLLSGDRVSLFDDGAGPPQFEPYSRALILRLDHKHRRATVVRAYHRSTDTSSESEGSVQMLPAGNVFAGFGATPYFSQFSAGGRLLFDAALPQDDGSYRAYRLPWTATPKTRPAAAARRTDPSSVAVYASWNGATAVARWQVLAGTDAASLTPVASAPRSGFETRIAVASTATLFAVRARDAHGRILATSPPVPVS
jgi:hypothetical protein